MVRGEIWGSRRWWRRVLKIIKCISTSSWPGVGTGCPDKRIQTTKYVNKYTFWSITTRLYLRWEILFREINTSRTQGRKPDSINFFLNTFFASSRFCALLACTVYTVHVLMYYYIQLIFFVLAAVQSRRRFFEFTGRCRSVETRKNVKYARNKQNHVGRRRRCSYYFLRTASMTRPTNRPPRVDTFIILLCTRTKY